MNKTIPKEIKGIQLSPRICGLIILVVVVSLLFVFWGLSFTSSCNKTTKKPEVVSVNKNDNAYESLKDISDSVPSATGKPNVIIKEGSQKQVVKGNHQDDYLKRLQAEMTKMKMQALQQAMGSSLTLGSAQNSIPSSTGNDIDDNGKNFRDAEIVEKTQMNTQYQATNMQGEKKEFYNTAGKKEDIYLNETTTDQKYSLEVKAGAVIPAILQSGINSDLPGTIIAKVRRNVYDSTTGKDILIPQGSTLIGLYSSQISTGQSRVLMVWSRVIFPDGENLNLEGMPGADLAGYAGLSDKVNNHYWKVFSNAIMMAIFTAGIQMSQNGWGSTSNTNSGTSAGNIVAGALGLQLGQAGLAMVQKNLNIQPTLEIRPGSEFNVIVTRDIPFRHPYKYKI